MQHVNVKIFAEEPVRASLADAIPVFHRWIQSNALPELLIDVADYAHVPAGPGVLLIAHEANYSLDNVRGRLGLLYNRKAVREGAPQENLRQAYEAALAATRMLEGEPEFQSQLKFRLEELEVTWNDRLLFPNTGATWDSLRGDVLAFFDGLFGKDSYSIIRPAEPRERFSVHARRSY